MPLEKPVKPRLFQLNQFFLTPPLYYISQSNVLTLLFGCLIPVRPYLQKLIIALIFILFSSSAFSCECAFEQIETSYQSASSVLIVTITGTEIIQKRTTIANKIRDRNLIYADFEIQEIIKGNPDGLKKLESETIEGSDCAAPILTGSTYLIFSEGNSSEFIGMCSPSRRIDDWRESDIEMLNVLREMK